MLAQICLILKVNIYKNLSIKLQNTLLNSKYVVYIHQKTSSTINSPLGKEVKMSKINRRSGGKFTITGTRFMEHHHGPADMDRCWSDIQCAPMRELSKAVRDALEPYDIGKTNVLPDKDSPYLSSDDPDFIEIVGDCTKEQTFHHPLFDEKPIFSDDFNSSSTNCHED